jgi:leucyl aminopeptidase
MKLTDLSLFALSAYLVHARFVEKHETDQVVLANEDAAELYHIELAPGKTMMVTEEGKWELRRVWTASCPILRKAVLTNTQNGQNFMDITDHPDLGELRAHISKKDNKFPPKPVLQKELKPMLEVLSKLEMRNHLETFTNFHTRYYKSDYGAQSSKWLLDTVTQTVKDAGADIHGATVEHFKHPWGQNSVIARVPGKSNKTVVIGAHQDSINLFLPSILSAPGADDDGSGTVTILEAMRVLLTSKNFIKGNAENTVEFHWYSAEEGGLLGSQAIFSQYAKTGRDVKAMLQQDMTGYIQKTLDAGEPESVGVITDFVDPELTDYIKKIVTEVKPHPPFSSVTTPRHPQSTC